MGDSKAYRDTYKDQSNVEGVEDMPQISMH